MILSGAFLAPSSNGDTPRGPVIVLDITNLCDNLTVTKGLR